MGAILSFLTAFFFLIKVLFVKYGSSKASLTPAKLFLVRGFLLAFWPIAIYGLILLVKESRGLLGLPVIPDWYWGSPEEFFVGIVICVSVAVLYAWTRAEDFCIYEDRDMLDVLQSRALKWKIVFALLVVILIADTIYLIFR